MNLATRGCAAYHQGRWSHCGPAGPPGFPAMIPLFVYGTLKRGFPLHEMGLAGAHFVGAHQTVDTYPMFVVGRWYTPMMLDEPGTGLHVQGELYEIVEAALSALDAMEHMGEPGNSRISTVVEPLGGGSRVRAIVYIKAPELVAPRHTGFLDDYQDKRFIPPWSRGGAE